MANKRINVDVGFNADQAGLEEIQFMLKRISDSADNAGKGLSNELKKAGQTAKTLGDILNKTFNSDLGTLNVTKFNQEMEKSGLTIKQVKSDLVGIGNQGATAYNKLAQAIMSTNVQLKQSSKLLDNMFTTFKNTIRYGISSSIFNNFTNSISKAYEYTRKLDTSLNDIRIVTGKSADEMDRFAEKANNAAKQLGASTLDMTEASLIYYQQGLSDVEAQARAETTVKVANVTGQAADEVSEQLTAVWNGYKVSAAETEAYIDKLAAVAKTTAADLEELSTGMSKVASAASAMGVNFDDLNAQIATIVSVTRQAPESVGTALKTIYARIGDLKVDGVDEFGVKLGEVSSQLEVMGVQVMNDNGDMKDMSTIMTEVAAKWDTWTQAQKQAAAVAIAGKRQYNNLIALFDNWDMYSKALETSTNALGTLQQEQDIYMESTQAKLTQLRATWQDLYKSVGNTKTINSTIDTVRNFVEVLNNFSDSFGGGLKTVVAFGAIVANIFNKQIADGINNTIQRAQILDNNLKTAQLQYEAIQQGIAETGANASTYDVAVAEATKEQLNFLQEIKNVQVGLTQEQQNQLINMGTEIKNLTEEKVYQEEMAKFIAERYMTEEQIAEILKANPYEVDILLSKYQNLEQLEYDRLGVLDKVIFNEEGMVKSEEELLAAIQASVKGEKQFSEQENKVYKELNNILENEKDQGVAIKKIIQYLDDCVDSAGDFAQVTLTAAENLGEVSKKGFATEEHINNIRQTADGIIEIGEQSVKTSAMVMGLTSALGTFTMAWSSVTSLINVWKDADASFGDKLTQTFMTLGFTLPMVASSFTKLNTIMESYRAIQEKNIIVDNMRNALKLDAVTITKTENGLYILENQLSKKKVKLTKEEAKERGILITEKVAEEGATEGIIVAETTEIATKTLLGKVVDKLILKTKALTTAIMSNPYLAAGAAVIAGLAAVVTILNKVHEAEQKNIESTREANKEKIENVKATQEQTDANRDLYDSFVSLYDKYKEGNATKEEMAKITEQLAEKYQLEGVELANLTGKYDDLAEAIKRARGSELQDTIKETQEKVDAAKENALIMVKSDAIRSTFSQATQSVGKDALAQWGYGNTAADASDVKFNKIAKNKGIEYFGPQGVYKDIESLLAFYDKVNETLDEADKTLSKNTRDNSEKYQNMKAWRDAMKEDIESYKEGLSELEKYNAVSTFESIDFNTIKSVDEYIKKSEEAQESLMKSGKSFFEAKELIREYARSSSNEFAKMGLALDTLTQKFPELKKLSGEDQAIVLTADIDIKGLNADQIKKKVELEKEKISPNDLTIPISFMAKISSSGKLSKSDLKEMEEEQSQLSEKYDVEFANFNDKSALDQAETLNSIIQSEIANREEYLIKSKQIAKEEVKIEQKKYDDLIKEKTDYENKIKAMKDNGGPRTSSEAADYTNWQRQVKALEVDAAQAENNIHDLNEAIHNGGLSFEELENFTFETWTTGIDGTINSIKTLNSSIADIGENWAIATDKIEQFAMNYPSILADQENFNYLQDGSIALTEKGQQALQDEVDLRKQDLKAQGEAYMLELQKQADLQYAQAQYYQDQIDALEAYMNNEADAADTEKALRESVYNFSAKVAELTGRTNTEVMGEIIENSNIARQAEEGNEQAIFDYWVDCGNAVAAYGQSLVSGDFSYTPPTPKALQGRNTGTNLSKESLDKFDKSYSDKLNDQLESVKRATEADRQKIQNQIDSLKKLRDAAIAKGDAEMAKRASYDAQIHKLENDLSNLGKGKNSKSKKNEKNFDDEFDRYYDIKKAVDLVNNALDKLSKIQEKLHGKELIQALKNENELIKQQSANYEELYRQQQIEAKELQNSLMGYGAKFDEQGFLTNYAAVTASALEQYKQKIAEYNAGKISEEAKNAYEESYNQMKKELERYDTLFYSEMKDTKDKLDEYYRKTMENNLKMWETEIQVSLDMSQAKRDWADFMKDINEDFKRVYKDLNIEMDHLMTKVETYSGMGTIETDLQAIRDVMNEIDKINSGQASDMFESISDAQEKLKELNKQLEDDAKNMKQLWQDAWDTYLEGIDQADSKLDDMMDRFEKVNEELEFQEKLIELLYGDEAYDLMSKLYDGQEKAMMNQIGAIKTQTDMWHQLWVESGATMDNQAEWSEDQKKYYEQWMECQSSLNDMTTEYIELLQKDYLNAVNKILKELEKNINGGMLEDIKTQWERIVADSDKYYDGIEKAYEVQKFANKIDQDIAKATGKNQQKLQALREKEITYLREKENLTKYDLDAAEARYQIALKEIALEEAQQNKTFMKLVRNEEGNWSYQYMADADEVAKAQDDLLTSYGDLYKLAGDAYQDNLESLQSLQETYLQSAKEINSDLTLSEEEREQKLLELRTWYEDQYNKLATENELYRQDLQTSGAGLLLQVYQQDQEAYEYMTSAEQAMLDTLISSTITSYQDLEEKVTGNYNNIAEQSAILMEEVRQDWTSSAQQIADSWNADDGESVKAHVQAAYAAIDQATADYQAQVDQLAIEVGRDFGPEGVSGAIDQASQSTDDLKQAVQDLCLESTNYLQGLKEVVNQVGQEFESIVGTVQSAILKVQEYLAVVGRAQSVSAQGYDITGGVASLGSYDGTGGGNGGGGGGDGYLEKWIVVGNDNMGAKGKNVLHTNGGIGYDTEEQARRESEESIKYGLLNGAISQVGLIQYKNLNRWKAGTFEATPFDTGGYTGAWDSTGKLAILHQKELVLNADDTANFLSGISLLRDMVSLNGSIEQSIAAAVGNMVMQLSGMNASSIGGVSATATVAGGDTYYVTAEFPNANDAEEIRQAIMNLPNVVSQYIHRNGL